MKFDLVNIENTKIDKQIEISDDVILAEPNEGLAHQLLLLQHTRPFRNANTKTRAEVRGGGRKPWKQKGTGNARAGSKRSPIFAGGGVIFGPKFHLISHDMPKRARKKALCSTLSMCKDKLVILDQFPVFAQPKTAQAQEFIDKFALGKKVLVILDQHDTNNEGLYLSLSNLKKVKIIHWQNLNPHDMLNAEVIITEQTIAKLIEQWLITYKTRKGVIV